MPVSPAAAAIALAIFAALFFASWALATGYFVWAGGDRWDYPFVVVWMYMSLFSVCGFSIWSADQGTMDPPPWLLVGLVVMIIMTLWANLHPSWLGDRFHQRRTRTPKNGQTCR